jgi:hypothetical protein
MDSFERTMSVTPLSGQTTGPLLLIRSQGGTTWLEPAP